MEHIGFCVACYLKMSMTRSENALKVSKASGTKLNAKSGVMAVSVSDKLSHLAFRGRLFSGVPQYRSSASSERYPALREIREWILNSNII